MIKKKTGMQFLVYAILPLLTLKMVYSYMGVPFEKMKTGSGWQQLAISDNITLVLTYLVLTVVILIFFYKAQEIKGTTETMYALLGFLAAIGWFFVDAFDVGVENVLYSTSNIWGYVTILAFAIGMQKDLFEVIIRQCIPFAIIFLLYSVVGYIQFQQQVHKGVLGNSQSLISMITAFWLFCIGSVHNLKEKKYPFFLIKLIATAFPIMSLLFGARSWVLQSIFWLFVYIYLEQSGKGFQKRTKLIFYGAAISLVLFFIIDKYFNLALNRMLAKGDTRTFQYEQLFAQINIWDLIIGNGQSFQYYQNGKLYSYIDNGYLMVLMRYGIWIAVPYVICFVRPLSSVWKVRKKFGVNIGYVWVIVMWLAALGGLSIYNMVIIDIKSIMLPIVAGYVASHSAEKNIEIQ